MGFVGLQEKGAERRAQRERDEAGDRRGGRDRHGKLTEELARDAGNEGGGDEHRGQHQRDREERVAHLVHGLVRRLPRAHAESEVALDVLDHHDRVVDHDADRQHQAEQREVVQRVAERRHDRKGADQRDRDGDDRDQRGAPGLQEQDHDDDHEEHGLVDRLEHRVDRLLR